MTPEAWAQVLTARLQPHLSAARIAPAVLPDCGDLQLFLLNEDFPQDALTPAEMAWALDEPSYWMFCWASGLAQARRVLRQPELVRGKTVLDFGTGSGIVAIAAARAGAAEVLACDIDPVSLEATAANAALNGVSVTCVDDFYRVDRPVDVLFAADVLYDAANRRFLADFLTMADTVWIADSRVKHLSVPGYIAGDSEEAETLPNLCAFDEFRRVTFYHGHRDRGTP